MKSLIAVAGLVVLTNAWMLLSGWRNRTLVRSEFELSEKSCGAYRPWRKGRPAELYCYAGEDLPRRVSNHPRALPRIGYAVLAIDDGKARLTEFATTPEELEGEGKIVVPAQHHPDWGISLALPRMTLAPSIRVPNVQEKFRAKIRIGRNYEPWLVDLR